MPRKPRVIAPGLPHHISQRGNGRKDIFLNHRLKETYLNLLAENAARYRLRILGYCIMTNHVHLVAVPETGHSLAFTLRRAHGRFAQFWNTEMTTVGHMWQNRYYSCAVEPPRVWAVLRYVEMNPVRAGMIRDAAACPWSSAAAHISGVDPRGVLDMEWWRENWNKGAWAEALAVTPDAGEMDAIRRASASGRPLATDKFVREMEERLGRVIAPRPSGRPSRKTAAAG